MGWGELFSIFDKLIPSRKASLVDRMRELESQLADALRLGNDTKAAMIRVQLEDLRTKVKSTKGDM